MPVKRSEACRKCGGTDWAELRSGARSCRACRRKIRTDARRREPGRSLFENCRTRSRIKGLPFTLERHQVDEIFERDQWTCVYCQSPVGSFPGPMRPNSVTLDRLVPEHGYTKDNIVLACHRCNSTKGEHTSESLRHWADLIDRVIAQRRTP